MNEPGDAGNPLQGLLGDLLKIIGGSPGGSTPWWEAARSLAHGVAVDGTSEANVDPLQRIKLEELTRVAELHVADATGLAVGNGAQPVTFVPLARGEWALRALDAWRPLLTKLVAAQESRPSSGGPDLSSLGLGDLNADAIGGGIQDILGKFALTMGPVLVGMQFGSAAGHLAQRALGTYALPLPWPASSELTVVPDNIAQFAEDWSLPAEETQLWVCVHELTAHAVLGLPHVADRIQQLLEANIGQAAAVQQSLTERLGADPGDPEQLQSLLSDPESLLADLLTPGQRYVSAQLTAVTTALVAYVDHTTARIAASLTGSSAATTEAWYRYQVEEDKGETAAGALFGLELGRAQVDRGASFVKGVVDRAGEEGLARLWTSARTLPTPAEVDAPGLWLERIDLPDDDDEAPAS